MRWAMNALGHEGAHSSRDEYKVKKRKKLKKKKMKNAGPNISHQK